MKIGFIGLGIMGEPMCRNIIKKHDDRVYVYDRVPEKVTCLQEAGGIACDNARGVAAKADLLITMVPKSEHSRSVYAEILPVLGPDKTCVDMSTIDPAVSVEIARSVKKTGAQFLDAPVVKSRPAAEAGTLGIYVGGEEAAYQKVRPILLYMGEKVLYMGENGRGLVMKICHNALVSQIQNGVNETLTLAGANGIDVPTFAQAISMGGGQNFYLDSKKDSLYNGNYQAAFSLENMNKDVNICLTLARQCGVCMPGEENVQKVYARAMEAGLGKEDFSATLKVVKDLHEEV